MAKLLALYKEPKDAAAFNRYYFSTHVPIARQISGLRRYEVSTSAVATPQGDSIYHLAAILSFDSMSAIEAALKSPQGQAAAADLANFADAGVELLVFETDEL